MLQSLPHVTSLTVLGCDMSNYIVDMPHWYEEVVAHGNSLPSGIQAALKPCEDRFVQGRTSALRLAGGPLALWLGWMPGHPAELVQHQRHGGKVANDSK